MLANYQGTIGSKTGFTDAARHTLVTAAERNGRRLVMVLMRGEQHPTPMWQQGAHLLDWGFSLPATTPAVGQLVNEAPPPPPPAPALAAESTPTSTLALKQVPPLLPIGLGAVAVAGMLISGLVFLRRRRS